MKTFQFFAIFALAVILFAFDAAAQLPLTTINTAVTENFDTLASTGTSSVVPLGWAFVETGTGANTTYAAGNGGLNTGNTYSYGTDLSGERALGGLLSGSVIPTFGAQFVNNTGQTIRSLDITYVGEQWRLGGTGRGIDRIDFQYSVNATSLLTGTWTDVDALDFAAPNAAPPGGRLDGNLPENRTTVSNTITGLNIAAGATFWIRWTDFNVTNSDDGLAVDDFSITPQAAGTLQFSAAAYSGLENGGPITVTVSRMGGRTGAASVGYGVAAMTAVGGESCSVGVDYITPSGTLNWIDGNAADKTFDIMLCPDSAFEPDEVFIVELTNATGATLGTPSAANVTILNDDAEPTPTPTPTPTPQVFEVDTNGDEPDAVPGDGDCATAGGNCTLRAAIGEANALAGTQSITFAAGITNIEIISNYEITTPMTITGRGADVLTINNVGPTTFDSRVFFVAAATVEISGMKITGGSVSSSAGGGVFVDNANMTLRRVWVADNTVTSGEGAGVISRFGTTTIVDSLISGNRVISPTGGNSGSAVSMFRGTVNIINTTISGNTANVAGGGAAVYNFGAGQPSTINIVSSTITNNTSNGGASTGGVYVLAGSTVNVQNSIIAGNFAGLEDPDVRGAFTSGGYNLIGDVGAASGFTQPTDIVGPVPPLNSLGGSTPLDPMLGPLADNGGPTMTHRPRALGPGIDKGNSFGATLDQRGFARIFDFLGIANASDGADIGAFEILGPTAGAVVVSGNIRTAGGLPIRNAFVSVSGGDLVQPMSISTGSFGTYLFAGLRAGQTYYVTVSAGRYTFAEPVRMVVPADDVDDLDFTAEPRR